VALEPFMVTMKRFRSRMGLIEKAMGALLVVTGIAFLTGSFTQVSYWLLETFPILGRLG
jgi:cytochrome c-type biogenesis protein